MFIILFPFNLWSLHQLKTNTRTFHTQYLKISKCMYLWMHVCVCLSVCVLVFINCNWKLTRSFLTNSKRQTWAVIHSSRVLGRSSGSDDDVMLARLKASRLWRSGTFASSSIAAGKLQKKHRRKIQSARFKIKQKKILQQELFTCFLTRKWKYISWISERKQEKSSRVALAFRAASDCLPFAIKTHQTAGKRVCCWH